MKCRSCLSRNILYDRVTHSTLHQIRCIHVLLRILRYVRQVDRLARVTPIQGVTVQLHIYQGHVHIQRVEDSLTNCIRLDMFQARLPVDVRNASSLDELDELFVSVRSALNAVVDLGQVFVFPVQDLLRLT
jgi:hypothetical protein